MNVFYNTEILTKSRNKIGVFADFSLRPIRYLFHGRSFNIIDHKVANSQQSYSLRSTIKTALAIALLIPALILGTLTRLITWNLMSEKNLRQIINNKPTPSAKIPSLSERKESSEQFISNLWAEYKKEHPISNSSISDLSYSFTVLHFDSEPGKMTSNIIPDRNLGNIVHQFENDREVFFAPIEQLQLEPNNYPKLADILNSAFATNRNMVVMRLCVPGHCIAGVFKSDGTFKIIDSMSATRVNIQELANILNKSGILDRDNKPIKFDGELINTHLQVGGNECVRFSTLYCYHIAKKRNINAYQEVNGAFAEGKLKTFEDYQNITCKKPLKSCETVNCDYKSFMNSWAYRSVGLKKDSWHHLTLDELSPNLKKIDRKFQYILINQKNSFPQLNNYADRLNFKLAEGEKTIDFIDQIPLPNNQLTVQQWSQPLQNFIPITENIRNVIIFEKDNPTPRFFELQKDQKIKSIMLS